MTETAKRLMKARGITVCECCGLRPAEEAHHCLYRRDNRDKKAGKVLNEDYNLQLVCKTCHEVKAKSFRNKQAFWYAQCQRYGRAVMLDWHERLPYKVKEIAYN